ncbi:MAG: response regulator [Clostridiales bacterium]
MYKLLIVDDDRVQRKLLIRFINNLNLNYKSIKEAENGKIALSLISEQKFDAIISDIKMPILNGIELLKEVRENHSKEIPIILVSTYSDFEYAKQGIQFNAFDYIVKPLEKTAINNILVKLQNHLEIKNTQNIEKNNIEKYLDASIEKIYTKEDESHLYNLIFYKKDSLDIFINELINKLTLFYNTNYFNIGLTLENIQKKIVNSVTENYKFIETLDIFNFSSIKELNSINKISQEFKNNLIKISDIIDYLHLNQKNSIVLKMCEYTMKNINKHIKIEDLAFELNYSSDHLLKTFKTKTGTTYSQYSKKLKMAKAKFLLESGLYKNYEICQLIGYKDYNHFSKVFKDYYGNSPTKYRNLNN